MTTEANRSGRLPGDETSADGSNPAHASAVFSVSEAAALHAAVRALLIRTEALLEAAEQCRCRSERAVNVLVPTHKELI